MTCVPGELIPLELCQQSGARISDEDASDGADLEVALQDAARLADEVRRQMGIRIHDEEQVGGAEGREQLRESLVEGAGFASSIVS